MESKESWDVRTALIIQNDNCYFSRQIDAAKNPVKILFATFPFRLIISQSWIKLFGWPFTRLHCDVSRFRNASSTIHTFMTSEPLTQCFDISIVNGNSFLAGTSTTSHPLLKNSLSPCQKRGMNSRMLANLPKTLD